MVPHNEVTVTQQSGNSESIGLARHAITRRQNLATGLISNVILRSEATKNLGVGLALKLNDYLDGILRAGDKLEAQARLGQTEAMGNHLAHRDSASPN